MKRITFVLFGVFVSFSGFADSDLNYCDYKNSAIGSCPSAVQSMVANDGIYGVCFSCQYRYVKNKNDTSTARFLCRGQYGMQNGSPAYIQAAYTPYAHQWGVVGGNGNLLRSGEYGPGRTSVLTVRWSDDAAAFGDGFASGYVFSAPALAWVSGPIVGGVVGVSAAAATASGAVGSGDDHVVPLTIYCVAKGSVPLGSGATVWSGSNN